MFKGMKKSPLTMADGDFFAVDTLRATSQINVSCVFHKTLRATSP